MYQEVYYHDGVDEREIRYVEDNRQQTTEIEVRVSECTDVAYCFLDSLLYSSNELKRALRYRLRKTEIVVTPRYSDVPGNVMSHHHHLLMQTDI